VTVKVWSYRLWLSSETSAGSAELQGVTAHIIGLFNVFRTCWSEVEVSWARRNVPRPRNAAVEHIGVILSSVRNARHFITSVLCRVLLSFELDLLTQPPARASPSCRPRHFVTWNNRPWTPGQDIFVSALSLPYKIFSLISTALIPSETPTRRVSSHGPKRSGGASLSALCVTWLQQTNTHFFVLRKSGILSTHCTLPLTLLQNS
jgi:hypothetical protein